MNEGTGESITILNTCSFIQAAINETEENIGQLIGRKKQGLIKYLVVTGCYPSRFKVPELEQRFPEVDLWLTTMQEDQVQAQLAQLVFKQKFAPSPIKKVFKLTPPHYTYLKISEGCNNWCSFCTIPKIRGEHVSKPLEIVLEEASEHLKAGAKELIIVAEDTTAWGEDIYGKPSLPLLLTELAKLPVAWIRLMYIFPSRVDDELIRVIKETTNICNYIDMPVQHICSDLLKQMNRRHDKPFLEKLLSDFKREIPELALRTTFIMGFPGETEDHVNELLEFMEKHPFDQLGCFAYSEEKETRSARLEPKNDMKTIRKRIQRVMEKQFEIASRLNQARVGGVETCIYEGNKTGRTYAQAPEVDGKVFFGDDKGLVVGNFYDITITGAKGYDAYTN